MNRKEYIVIILFMVLGFLCYSSNYYGNFIFDDARYTVNNRLIHWSEYSWENLKSIKDAVGFSSRPVTILSFAVLYPFFHGSLASYHIFSIFIHAGVGLALFCLIKQLIELDNYRLVSKRNSLAVSLIAALIWLVHPLNSQPVNYIIQRSVLLSSFFYLWALFYFIRARFYFRDQKVFDLSLLGYGFISIGFFALAMGSKSIAITFPIVCVMLEFMFFRSLNKKSFIIGLASTGLLLGVSAYWRGGGEYIFSKNLNYSDDGNISHYQHILTGFRAVFVYLKHFFWPNINQYRLEYSFPVSQTLFSPATTFLSLLAIISAVTFSLKNFYKYRLPSFVILFFLGNMALETFIIKLDLIYEHRAYLPCALIALPLVAYLFKLKGIVNNKLVIMVSVLIAVLSLLTHQRSKLWSEPLELYKSNLTLSPSHSRLLMNYFGVLIDNWTNGAFPMKKEQLKQLENILLSKYHQDDPYSSLYGDRLMVLYLIKKDFKSADDFLKKSCYGRTVEEVVYHTRRYAFYARVLGAYENAAEKCLDLFSYTKNELFLLELISLKVHLKKYGEADEISKNYLRQNPKATVFVKKLGCFYLQLEDYKRAKRLFQKYLEIIPNDEQVNELLKALP